MYGANIYYRIFIYIYIHIYICAVVCIHMCMPLRYAHTTAYIYILYVCNSVHAYEIYMCIYAHYQIYPGLTQEHLFKTQTENTSRDSFSSLITHTYEEFHHRQRSARRAGFSCQQAQTMGVTCSINRAVCPTHAGHQW